MTKGQLAILPVLDGRRAERRIVNLAARLREPGARMVEVEVVDLSVRGFMAEGPIDVEPGAGVWLKLPGLEPQSSRVVWSEDDRAGFEFTTPLHPGSLDLARRAALAGRPALKPRFGRTG